MLKATNIFLIIIIFSSMLNADINSDIRDARIYFYKASKEEEYLVKALDSFIEISKQDQKNKARWKVYEGSLTSMKAMYVFWPQSKLEFANTGIDIMEKWIKKADTDIEALFIYGTSCYYMPFFMGQSENADWAFSRLIDVAAKKESFNNKELMNNVLDFFNEELELNSSQINKIKSIKGKLIN